MKSVLVHHVGNELTQPEESRWGIGCYCKALPASHFLVITKVPLYSFFFFFEVLGFKLRAYTLNHFISSFL
jgi:hypothetical protein